LFIVLGMENKIKKFFRLAKKGKWDLIFYLGAKALGFNTARPLPASYVIEPANFCNLRCPVCPTGSGKLNRPPRLMSLDEFKMIIDQIEDYSSKISLFNYGEPFLNKDIFEMIKYAADRKMFVKISTNGQLLDKNVCLKIVKSGLQRLIVSFDGIDDETLNKYRLGANANKTIDALKNIKEAKDELKSETPVVEVQFLLMKHNEHQKEEMAKLAKDLGADIYAEKSLNLYGRSEFQDKMTDFLPVNSLSRYEKKEDGSWMLKGELVNDCWYIRNATVINSNGEVAPCCYDLYSNFIMGNVFREPIKSIWKGDKYRSFRKRIWKDRTSISMCEACPEGRRIKVNEKKSIG